MILNMDKLDKILKFASTNVPFYQKYKQENRLNDFNIVNKEDLISAESSNISVKHLLDYYNNKLVKKNTSGSTGQCMEITWSHVDRKKSLLPLWILRYKYYGIKPDDPYCYFFSFSQTGEIEKDKITIKSAMVFNKMNLNENRLLEICKEIISYHPIWLLLQPSIAVLLCDCIERNGLEKNINIKYVEFTGEMLRKDVRDRVQRVFGCEYIANQYGANEVNSIAYECNYGNMHCMEENVHVEIDNINDKGIGNIIVTSLHNYSMPFIRYNIGDRGKLLHNKKCKCGNKSPILILENGRENDWIITENGEKYNVYSLTRIFDCINALYENCIHQYKVIQRDYTVFDVYIVADEEVDNTVIIDLFYKNIADKYLKGCQFNITFHKNLFIDKNGKMRFFESRI